jgi:hypothetical protein
LRKRENIGAVFVLYIFNFGLISPAGYPPKLGTYVRLHEEGRGARRESNRELPHSSPVSPTTQLRRL